MTPRFRPVEPLSRFTIRLTPDAAIALREAAQHENVSIATVVRDAVLYYHRKIQRESAINKGNPCQHAAS